MNLLCDSIMPKANPDYYSVWSAVGSISAVAGFIVQFLGLGALHWSATFTLLAINLLMTGVRAWIRRGLTKDPNCVPIPEDIELVWLALRTARNDWDKFLIEGAHNNPSVPDCEWGILTHFIAPVGFLPQNTESVQKLLPQIDDFSNEEFILGFCPKVEPGSCPEIIYFKDLRETMPNIPIGAYADLASIVATTLEGIIRVLKTDKNIVWNEFKSEHKSPLETGCWQIDLQKSRGVKASWHIDVNSDTDATRLTSDLTGGLSIWMYSFTCVQKALHNLESDGSLQYTEISTEKYDRKPISPIRILGSSETSTAEELQAWFERLPKRVFCDSEEEWEERYRKLDKEPASVGPVMGLHYSGKVE